MPFEKRVLQPLRIITSATVMQIVLSVMLLQVPQIESDDLKIWMRLILILFSCSCLQAKVPLIIYRKKKKRQEISLKECVVISQNFF